jgi:hypothetical protein
MPLAARTIVTGGQPLRLLRGADEADVLAHGRARLGAEAVLVAEAAEQLGRVHGHG